MATVFSMGGVARPAPDAARNHWLNETVTGEAAGAQQWGGGGAESARPGQVRAQGTCGRQRKAGPLFPPEPCSLGADLRLDSLIKHPCVIRICSPDGEDAEAGIITAVLETRRQGGEQGVGRGPSSQGPPSPRGADPNCGQGQGQKRRVGS